MIDRKALIAAAFAAQKNSHSPYSHYRVGAALLTDEGEVFGGCNIENAAYSLTVCAERTALFCAVANGKKRFSAIAIVGGVENGSADFAFPCGACRQALSEFCKDDFEIIVAKSEDEYSVHTMSELLPNRFSDSNLK